MKKNIASFMMFAILTLGLTAQNLSNVNGDLNGPSAGSFSNAAVSVDCEHVTLPIVETFDDLADCWQYFSADPNNGNNAVLGPCADGNNFVFRFSSMMPVASSNFAQYLITPELPTLESSISITFDARSLYESQSLQLGYSTTTDDISAFTWMSVMSIPVAGGVCSETFPEGTTYIAIKYASSDKYYLYIDNLTIASSEDNCTDAVSVLPWTEDFSSGCFPPECWSIDFTNIDTTWKLFYLEGAWASCSGTAYDRTEKLITRTLDFSNYHQALAMNIDFMSNFSYVDNEYVDLKIYASVDGGETFSSTPLWKLSDYGPFGNWQRTSATVNLSNLAGESNVKLAFAYEGSLAQVILSNVMIVESDAVEEHLPVETRIYPNPAYDDVTIISQADIVRVEIYNISGQKMKDICVNGSDVSISMSNLASGLYMMKIYTQEGIVIKKVDVVR